VVIVIDSSAKRKELGISNEAKTRERERERERERKNCFNLNTTHLLVFGGLLTVSVSNFIGPD